MGKHVALPALATAGGAAAFVLRRWQLASAYDAETQLFRSGSPASPLEQGFQILQPRKILLNLLVPLHVHHKNGGAAHLHVHGHGGVIYHAGA